MNPNRNRRARKLLVTGGGLIGLGIFLLIVQLIMLLAWYAAGIIAAVGLIIFLVGALMMKS